MLIGYSRVSSEGDRQSTNLQRDALLAAGVDARHLLEDRASGATAARPGLAACLDYLSAGDTLVVWKLDRLGRSLPHLIDVVADLRRRGIAFRSLTEAIDTASPQGELLFHLFGSLAQFERALISERVRAGIAAAAARGRKGGRPRAINPEVLDQVRALLAAGSAKAAVCRVLGVRRSTLNDALRRMTVHVSDLGDVKTADTACAGRPIAKPPENLPLPRADRRNNHVQKENL